MVLCAGDADTLAMQRELEDMVQELQSHRDGIIWIPKMVSRQTTIAFIHTPPFSAAPQIYEPFGIINLEAMACGTPVVGSAVGGINEVVVDGETGFLVDPHLSPEPPHDPIAPAKFEHGLADAINRLAADPELRERMGQAGRRAGRAALQLAQHRPADLRSCTAGCARNGVNPYFRARHEYADKYASGL
jgi:starch synthase